MRATSEIKINSIRLIANPASGKNKGEALPLFEEAFRAAGVEYKVDTTKKAGDAQRLAKAAAKQDVGAVAVCGGDGTLKEAAAGLMGTGMPMLILPAGSANVMATELGIPKDIKELAMLIEKNEYAVKTIDAASSPHGFFMCRASLGFEADMVKGADRETKNKFGCLAYFLSGVRALKKMELADYRVTVDGEEHRVQGLTCIVTNAGNMGFSKVSLDKNIDISDGLLDVLVVKKANLSLIKNFLSALMMRERPDNWDVVAHWQGREISVISSPEQRLEVDGESLPKGPLKAKVLPGAVSMLIPLQEAEAKPAAYAGAHAA